MIELACSPEADIRELEKQENRDENQDLAEDDNLIVEGSVISDSALLSPASPTYNSTP